LAATESLGGDRELGEAVPTIPLIAPNRPCNELDVVGPIARDLDIDEERAFEIATPENQMVSASIGRIVLRLSTLPPRCDRGLQVFEFTTDEHSATGIGDP